MYRRVYNIVAIMIRRIEEEKGRNKRFLIDDRSYNQQEAKKILQDRFPILYEEDGSGYKEITDLMENVNWEEVERFSQEYENVHVIFSFLRHLDMALEKRTKFEGNPPEGIRTIDALNNNVEETQIQVLPKMSAYWERGSGGSQHSYDISRLLKNIMYIDTRIFSEMQIEQIKHSFLSSSMFYRAEKKGILRIGVSFISRNLHIMTRESGENKFCVDAVTRPGQVEKNVKRVLEEARREQVDIVFFPEMIGSSETDASITKYLLEAALEMSSEEYPALIVLPSKWEENQNSALVLTGNGAEVCSQQKQYPYDGPVEPGGKPAQEDLSPDGILHLIHCQGLGRMAIMICKDFLITEYLQMLLEILRVTLILVPSMTTGEYDFKTHIHMCEHADCCVMQGNCCSAQWMVAEDQRGKLDTCGYCLKSGKNQNPKYVQGGEKIISFTKPDNCRTGECKEACLFIEDFYYRRGQQKGGSV